MKFRILMILLAVSLISAGCTPQVKYIERVRVDTIKAASPIIEETLAAKVITDTLVMSSKEARNDTVRIIKYFPREKKFYIKVKPDTVKVIDVDTLQTTQIIEKITDNKIEKIIIILLIVGLISITIKIRR